MLLDTLKPENKFKDEMIENDFINTKKSYI